MTIRYQRGTTQLPLYQTDNDKHAVEGLTPAAEFEECTLPRASDGPRLFLLCPVLGPQHAPPRTRLFFTPDFPPKRDLRIREFDRGCASAQRANNDAGTVPTSAICSFPFLSPPRPPTTLANTNLPAPRSNRHRQRRIQPVVGDACAPLSRELGQAQSGSGGERNRVKRVNEALACRPERPGLGDPPSTAREGRAANGRSSSRT
ncbi:hypothetical protein B0H19DRAFT_1074201 [Mycena capillaripes]|nr:hypothetical protein B0H19DRAFT_1074201 [Mycena capillaripes]